MVLNWGHRLTASVTASTAPARGLLAVTLAVACLAAGAPLPESSANAAEGGELTYVLAEGATGPLFDLDVVILNPNGQKAPVEVRFLRANAAPILKSLVIPARSRRTIRVNEVEGLATADLSTVVVSLEGLPLVVERSMFWTRTLHYGGHGGTAVDQPRTNWYFAEGSQGFFDTYVLLANARAVPAAVTIRFLTETDGPVSKHFVVDPFTRQTVWAGWFPELVNRSFSLVVTSDVAIVAERAMYFGGARTWEGGHGSAGVPAPATNWYHAEGATGPYFDLWLLLGNPNDGPANVTVTYLLESQSIDRHLTIPGNSRRTIYVAWEDARLEESAVSMVVNSDVPIVSERAMYWPRGGWYEAHNSPGTTSSDVTWGLAEGRAGGSRGYETYVLVSNASATDVAEIEATFLIEDGPAIVRTFTVPPETRFNIVANEHVPSTAVTPARFGTVIRATNGVAVSSEMAMYWNAADTHGQVQPWAGGLNVTATALPVSDATCDPVLEQDARAAGELAAQWLEASSSGPLSGLDAPLGAYHLRHFLGGTGSTLTWSDGAVAGLPQSPADIVRSAATYQTQHANLQTLLQQHLTAQQQQGGPITAGSIAAFLERQPLTLPAFAVESLPFSHLLWAFRDFEFMRLTVSNVTFTGGTIRVSVTYELTDTYDVHDWLSSDEAASPHLAIPDLLYLQANCPSVRTYSQSIAVPDTLVATLPIPNVMGIWRLTRTTTSPWNQAYTTFTVTLFQSGTTLSGTIRPWGLAYATPIFALNSYVSLDGTVTFGNETLYNPWNDFSDAYFILKLDASGERMSGHCNSTFTCSAATAEKVG